jgi:Rrf2 family protein
MTLADTGMIDARRGPGGGLKLGRPPEDISLMEIVSCFDGKTLFEDCALGLPGCQESDHKCPIHEQWAVIREEIKTWWSNTSLADFSPISTTECMKHRVASVQDNGPLPARIRGRWH